MHGETATRHSASMHADVLAMQETCRSAFVWGRRTPNMGKLGHFEPDEVQAHAMVRS